MSLARPFCFLLGCNSQQANVSTRLGPAGSLASWQLPCASACGASGSLVQASTLLLSTSRLQHRDTGSAMAFETTALWWRGGCKSASHEHTSSCFQPWDAGAGHLHWPYQYMTCPSLWTDAMDTNWDGMGQGGRKFGLDFNAGQFAQLSLLVFLTMETARICQNM